MTWRSAIERAVPARLASLTAPSLRAVINATGVILHTNLGRAPLARAAVERVAALAGCTEPRIRPRTGNARAPRRPRRAAALPSARRRGRGRGQQQRRRDAADAGGNRRRARSDRLARRAGGDRRRIPRARRDGAVRRHPARGRDHQPHPHRGLRRGHRRAHRGDSPRPSVELPHRRLHRASRSCATSSRWRTASTCR